MIKVFSSEYAVRSRFLLLYFTSHYKYEENSLDTFEVCTH